MPTTVEPKPFSLSTATDSDQRPLFIVTDDLHAFTLAQTGERLGVSLTTVERLVARGELHELRIGRAVRISALELRRYLSGGDK